MNSIIIINVFVIHVHVYVYYLFLSFSLCHFLFLQVTHLDFAVAGGILFAETYSITPNKDREYIRKVAEAIILPEFVPKKGLYL